MRHLENHFRSDLSDPHAWWRCTKAKQLVVFSLLFSQPQPSWYVAIFLSCSHSYSNRGRKEVRGTRNSQGLQVSPCAEGGQAGGQNEGGDARDIRAGTDETKVEI